MESTRLRREMLQRSPAWVDALDAAPVALRRALSRRNMEDPLLLRNLVVREPTLDEVRDVLRLVEGPLGGTIADDMAESVLHLIQVAKHITEVFCQHSWGRCEGHIYTLRCVVPIESVRGRSVPQKTPWLTCETARPPCLTGRDG